jgi:hypothetical protein
MSAKHTPGPWHLRPEIVTQDFWNGDLKRIVSEQGTSVGLVDTRDDYDKANAALIAAAPEMLEALEYLVKEVTVLPGTGRKDGNIGHRHMNKILDAIKKARGEL